MKDYEVSLVIITNTSVYESQIQKLFKIREIEISKRDIDDKILWRIEFENSDHILGSIKSITSIICVESLEKCTNILEKIYFDIVVYCDTYTCSFTLSNECLQLIAGLHPKLFIEVTCYPTEEE